MKLGVVIVSAGIGQRLGSLDKSTMRLAGKPLFAHSLDLFKSLSSVIQIALVLRKKNFSLAKKFSKDKKIILVEGGKTRKDSVCNGLKALDKRIDTVLIHDGARPLLTKATVLSLIEELKRHPAVIIGSYSRDTLKLINKNQVIKTIDRKQVFQAETPQGFRRSLIAKAYQNLKNNSVTDDAQAVELLGEKVKIIESDVCNFKITYPEDITLAKAILGFDKSKPTNNYSFGLGFDVHKFSKKPKDLILAGVKIPAEFSLAAVSDGDLVLHAVSDALCGAARIGDIGDYFPPESKHSKGISGRKIVKLVLKAIKGRYQIKNIDVTIVADKPRLVKYKKAMLASLKKIFMTQKLNLKLKSKEGLAILGSKNSISCLATALLLQK